MCLILRWWIAAIEIRQWHSKLRILGYRIFSLMSSFAASINRLRTQRTQLAGERTLPVWIQSRPRSFWFPTAGDAQQRWQFFFLGGYWQSHRAVEHRKFLLVVSPVALAKCDFCLNVFYAITLVYLKGSMSIFMAIWRQLEAEYGVSSTASAYSASCFSPAILNTPSPGPSSIVVILKRRPCVISCSHVRVYLLS